MNTATWVGAAATAYLAGSIPFGLLIARYVKGIDIRQHGSHNIGATNVGRVLGGKWGAFVLVLDLLKGLLPTLLLPLLFAPPPEDRLHLMVLCGTCAIIGHMFPCWLGFRGGKGVATALGTAAGLAPWCTLVAFLVFASTFAAKRIVSLSSMLAAIAFAICRLAMTWPAPFSREQWSLSTFALAIPALIILRHRGNIVRLLRGEEKAYRVGSEPTSAKPDQTEPPTDPTEPRTK
jgi:glycerol-3-phosphate acyltransferase PlsY